MRHALWVAVAVVVGGCDTGSMGASSDDGGDGGREVEDAGARTAADVGFGPDGATSPDAAAERSDGGPCAAECAAVIDCPQPGWRCEAVEVAGCAEPARRCRSNCLPYRTLPTRDDRCCLGDERVSQVCTPERGFECPDGATTWTSEALGVFSAAVFGCGELAAEPEPGVPCGLTVDLTPCAPEQYCCYSIVYACSDDAVERSCYAAVDCDGPEDCADGTLCCATPSPSYESGGPGAAHPLSTRCVAPDECPAPNMRACNEDADCGAGDRCCPERHGGIMGLCAASCPGSS